MMTPMTDNNPLKLSEHPAKETFLSIRARLNHTDREFFKRSGLDGSRYYKDRVCRRMLKYADHIPEDLIEQVNEAAERVDDKADTPGRRPIIDALNSRLMQVKGLNSDNWEYYKTVAEEAVGVRVPLFISDEQDSSGYRVVHRKHVEHLLASGMFSLASGLKRRDFAWMQPPQRPTAAPEVQWASLKRTPYPFQADGIQYMVAGLSEDQSGFLLSDAPGLGKTLQAIYTVETYKRQAVVVCPAAVRYNWVNEIFQATDSKTVCVLKDKAFFSTLQGVFGANAARFRSLPEDADYVIMSFEATRTLTCCTSDPILAQHPVSRLQVTPGLGLEAMFKERILIVDEAHYSRNVTAKRSQAVLAVSRACNRVISATGTPIDNYPKELWTMLTLTRRTGLFQSHGEYDILSKKRDGLLEINNRLIESGAYLRRLKKDVLTDLPSKLRQDLVMVMGPKASIQYESAKQGLRKVVNGQAVNKSMCMLAILTELQTLANTAKVDPIAEEVTSRAAVGSQSLVCSTRAVPLREICDKLLESGVSAAVLDGGTDNQERVTIQKDFEDGKLMCVLTTVSTGLNFQSADTAYMLDFPWAPGTLEQKEDRCLVGNSLVYCLTSDRVGSMGLTELSNVTIGDKVLTDKGTWESVTDAWSHEHRGMMTSISYVGFYEPIVCTHDHRILVSRGGETTWVEAHSVLPSDSMVFPLPRVRVPLKEVDTTPWGIPHLRTPPQAACSAVGCSDPVLARGLCRPHYRAALKAGDPAPKSTTGRGRYIPLPDTIQIDDDWLYLFGNYLAEGFSSIGGSKGSFISLSAHEKERHRLDSFSRFFSRYGLKSTIYTAKGSKGIELRCFSRELATWFLEWFGHGAHHKSIPVCLQALPADQAKVFLKGYTDGDGHLRGSQQEWVSVSQALSYQMCQVAMCAGYTPCLRSAVHPTYKTVQYIGSYCTSKASRNNGVSILRRVREVKTYLDKVRVYDITVEKNESFCTGFSTVHNCHRIGQTCQVTIVNCIAADIDRHKLSVLSRKREVAAAAIDGGDSPMSEDSVMAEVVRLLVE